MKAIASTIIAAMACLGIATASDADATIITSHSYTLFSHPDGDQAPPIYGLRLDGIERYLTGSGRVSDSWTFAFDTVTADVVLHDDPLLNTFSITGTGIGGLDVGGGSHVASSAVSFNFTYTGFDAAADFDPLNPDITISDTGRGASEKGFGSITFEQSVLGIDAGTSVGLIAWGDNSGRLFSFQSNNHRLDCPQSEHCGFPVGWGWMGLTGLTASPFHTTSQDWLFASRYVVTQVPLPQTALFLLVGLAGVFSLRRRNRV
ncbi:hypothetical protein JCM17845_08850 [Iodidimonas gelatinilytica]|uniref:PEP-CTERM sorting domain-containing protein n=1 Tax=Iodidimonas gelatinilytica TaxID=1236966 RepID=A0A5A7MWE6_9PROT|nr:VPLPA-CTERM sorting domain-containing protein [Iodidimonas gelatinilytica]GER00262.1 hypothetical protein JCM17845_08850 [Iodidimonas gelatinilytica]